MVSSDDGIIKRNPSTADVSLEKSRSSKKYSALLRAFGCISQGLAKIYGLEGRATLANFTYSPILRHYLAALGIFDYFLRKEMQRIPHVSLR